MITSAASVTLAGVELDPIRAEISCDNSWSPTWKADVRLASRDLRATLKPATNLVTNPSASVDLTDGVAGSATLVRQTNILVFGAAHRTAWRINPSGPASQFTLGGDYGGMRLGTQPGKTYTISATFYIDGALSGTEGTISRQIAVGCIAPSQNGGAAYYHAISAKAPNIGQTQTRLRMTFTVPYDATSLVFRFFNGHSTGSAYWTDIMLVEGDGLEPDGTPMEFFDGDSLPNALYTYAWAGAAGKSSSSRSRTFPTPAGPMVDPRMYPPARVRWWYGEGDAPAILVDVSMTVRKYLPNDTDDTVELTLMSDEIRLQDLKNAGTSDYAPGAMTLWSMLAFAMRLIGNLPLDPTGIPNPTIPATATVWKVGDSLDTWLQGPLRANGVELYQDAQSSPPTFRGYLMNDSGKSPIHGTVRVKYARELISAPVGIDMDSDDFADAVVAIYQWTDSAGASQRRIYSSVPPALYHKVRTTTYNTPDPGLDPTPTTRAFTSRAGYVGEISCLPIRSIFPPDYLERSLRLGDTLTLVFSTGLTYTANVNSIKWSYPDDLMTIGLSNVVFSGYSANPL